MKKIIAAAAGLMMVGAMASSVSAVESQFGGYWRARGYTMIDMNDDGTRSVADSRTRLYYTAIFNENFQFVNKFEFDSHWGGNALGDVGADGVSFEVKNSYADFKVGSSQFKVGTQGATLARGFLFADDFSGVVAIFNPTDTVALPFAWIKVTEEYEFWGDKRPNAFTGGVEQDHYAFFPVITVSDTLTLNPYLVYSKIEGADTDIYWGGMDVDMKTDAFGAWGTAIYNGGDYLDNDISAFLLAAGANANMGAADVHGQVFYASGDDDGLDGDVDDFQLPAGRSYYWSEIMGLGIFDLTPSESAPGDGISNIWAANVGVKMVPMPKWTVGLDVWYAQLVEEDEFGEDDLGLEIDLVVTYKIMDNLNLDLVGAYLLAGDATAGGEEDPIEVGARLSLAF